MDPNFKKRFDTIKDLLPNEHILNFHSGRPTLPSWLPERLKLIMGAGDLDQDPMGLNVKFFSMFDVFYCEPWDDKGSLRKNIEYLLHHDYHKKVICFIDNKNLQQRKAFVDLFKGRFEYIDGYGGHTPHLEVKEIEQLLVPGGVAVNIEEPSEMVVTEAKLYQLLVDREYTAPLTLEELQNISGHLELWSKNDTQQLKIYRQYILAKMFKEFRNPKIQFVGSYLDIEEKGFEYALKFAIDEYYLHKKYEPILPANIKGEIKLFQRPWQDRPFYTFVLTKQETKGGRRRRSTQKQRRRRSRTYRK